MSEEARQVPPPAFLKSVINQARKEPQITPGEHKDKIIAEFSQSDAWKILREYIQAKQLMLGKQLRESTDKASLEEIGFRFMIMDQVNQFASDIINRVDSVAKIMELQNERRADSDRSE